MLKCTWCCKDTSKIPCENCGSDAVVDPYKEHNHHWSRKTIATIACTICDLEVSNTVYFSGSAPTAGKKERTNEIRSRTDNGKKGKDGKRPKRQVQAEKDSKREA